MMSSFAGFNSTYNNSYESAPIFDNDSVDSSDTPATPPPPTSLFQRTSRSPSPIAQIAQISTQQPPPQIPHTQIAMPSINYNNNSHKIDIDSKLTKTTKQSISLSDILNTNLSTGISSRTAIFQDVSCGAFVFDIAFYTKRQLNTSNGGHILMICIEQKSSRGKKRKASQSQSDSNATHKKRRLNNSQPQTQSYSIGNGVNGHYSPLAPTQSDTQIISDNIEVLFTINISGNNCNQSPFTIQHKCKFGEADPNSDGESVDLGTWENDEDSETDTRQFPHICSFQTETFQELSDRICSGINDCDSSDAKIPKKQCLSFWFELQIENDIADDKNPNFDARNRIFRRPKFSKRKINKFVGIKNEGATCYMNSMLQTLYHIASLRRNVYKIPVGHEAEQKKIKEAELKKQTESDQKQDNNAMDVCHGGTNHLKNDLSDDEDDDDTLTTKKSIKPPISLELQRLFYQLQTGAESNHQNEYELNSDKVCKPQLNDNDDGNLSDCSVFTLQSDADFANGKVSEKKEVTDDDVEMDSNDNMYDVWQSSYDKAVSTEDLIKSFGWSGGDAFVQHDVQEFLRVLMDKIEAKVKGTPAEKIVEKLFSGEYQSYVSCKNVQYESVRNEHFQDIQLTIPKSNKPRNRSYNRYGAGDNLSDAPDIYDCIRKFIEPETLDGNNQYYANDELKKQDADKGLRFKRFPPVLFLQLCRFEIDHYQHTSKINDPVKFYQDIDLNPFVYVEEKEDERTQKSQNKQGPNTYYNHMGIDVDGRGEFSYQLFSVLVHSGSTYGGHYFAYINPSGESDKWYKFDDENVSCVEAKEATVKQFGGSSRQSAYMLVYIQKRYAKQMLQEINEKDIPLELRKYFRKEKEKQQKKRREELENRKKCKISYLNGHNICNVNVLDMGMRQLLTAKKIYKDVQFKQILTDWGEESQIALTDLMVWNYTERKNKTLRSNREIKFDLDEEYEAKDDEKYSADDIKRHKIKTNPVQKHPKGIHDRIGNIMEKKRMFVLLDKSKVNTLENKSVDCGKAKTILIALKYFDFLTQKLYFVDWLLIKTMSVTFGDIISYVEDTLVPNTKDKRSYFQTLYDYNKKINEYELLGNDCKQNDKFLLFEEECVLKNKGSRDDSVCKVNDLLEADEKVSSDYFDGDIFVFQLNPFHPYFNTLKPDTQSIDNIKEIMDENENENGGKKSLSLSLRLIKNGFEQRGVYWYAYLAPFIQSQLDMTCIELKVRDNAGWKTWSKALILQCISRHKLDTIDKEVRKKITKSRHKWFVEKRSTYGMIRRKLGAYYNINPLHIEIWLPQHSFSYNKWDFGSQGRGKWNIKLEKLLSSGKHEWNEVCMLKFEIQTYNVCDFDKMTLYDDSNSSAYTYYNSNNSHSDPIKFSKRIKELAMFNFDIIAPNKPAANSGNMTMSFSKNWAAEILIQHILKEVIENPIFGYTFFSNIIKYVREERGDKNNTDDDITILKSLSAERFLVCDENDNKVPSEFYMKKEYKMPGHFSQIKYTDFRIQFLAKNDPLLMAFNASSKNKNIESKNDEMEVDSDNIENVEDENETETETKNKKQQSKGLWVYFKKYNPSSYTAAKLYQRIRIVLQNGECLKDVIMKYLKPYLKISNVSPSSSKQSSVDKEEDNKQEKSECDLLFEQILETHKFLLKGAGNSIPVLKKAHLELTTIFDSLSPKMYLIIQVPSAKKKYTSNYDKPLTIID